MKINEYAANVSEYTEVVDAPYNHKGTEQELDERPMGIVKGGLQKLGAKLLPGSYGDRMQGKVEVGQEANQLYKEFNKFLGKSGYKSTDDAIKAFLKQKGINVNIDNIIKQVAPAPAAPPAAPAPAPVAESVEQLNRILVLSGRSPKNVLNETKIVKKKVLTEAVALNRGALNKIFMQVAQQMSGGAGGEPAASGAAPAAAPAASRASAPAPAAPRSAAPAPQPAAGGSDFGGDGPAPAPQPAAQEVPGTGEQPNYFTPTERPKGFNPNDEQPRVPAAAPKAAEPASKAANPPATEPPAVQPPAPPTAGAPLAAKPSIGSRIAGAAAKGVNAAAKGIGAAAGTVAGAASNGAQAFKGALANTKQKASQPSAEQPAPVSTPAAAAEPPTSQPNNTPVEPAANTTKTKVEPAKTPRVRDYAKERQQGKDKRAREKAAKDAAAQPAASNQPWSMSTGTNKVDVTGTYDNKPFSSTQKEQTNEDVKLQKLLSKISMKF
jgi:hypothetical protein